jgi:hypothetical protein
LEHASFATAMAVRDVSLRYLLYVTYPSPRVEETNPHASSPILRQTCRTASSKLHHFLAFLHRENFRGVGSKPFDREERLMQVPLFAVAGLFSAGNR